MTARLALLVGAGRAGRGRSGGSRRHPRRPPTPPAARPPPAAGQGLLQGPRRPGHEEDALLRAAARGGRCAAASSPFVAGQVLTLQVDPRRARRASACAARSRPAGASSSASRSANPGKLRLVVKHAASAAAGRRSARVTARSTVVDWQAGAGARGAQVLLLQRALAELHFATPGDRLLRRRPPRGPCIAFRKTNDMGRDGYATHAVYASCSAARARSSCATRRPRASTWSSTGRARCCRWRRRGKPVPHLPLVVGHARDAHRVREVTAST